MAGYDDQRFKAGTVAIPPISVYAAEGETWPDPALRLSVLSTGDANARLRCLGLGAFARAEAQRVVSGPPTGGYLDISTTDDFAITAAAGQMETFDLRFVVLPRAGGFVRRLARLAVVSRRGSGI